MKNNGYDLSRKWFDFAFEHSEVKCQHTALFMWIIELNNRLGWKEQFGIPTNATMEGLHIGNKRTYLDALSDLAKWNFIQIISESKNQYSSTIISICRSKKATALHTALDTALIQHSNGIEHSIEHSSAPIDKQRNQETNKQRNNYIGLDSPESQNEVIVEDANEKKVTRKRFVKPEEHEVYNLMGELNATGKNFMGEDRLVNFARTFMDHYEANGWIVGKSSMKDWQSTVRNWMRREWDKIKNQKSYGKQSNSTADSIAKANALYAEAVAISRARDNTRPDWSPSEA
jgi:hypothetical protein